MKHKGLLYSLVFLLSLCLLPCPALAENQRITILVNGAELQTDVAPVMESDRVLVPMRAIFEALGADVNWNDETETASAVRDRLTLSITVGQNVLYKDGQATPLDVPARLVQDRTMVPVRAVSEGLGADVVWIEAEQRVVISTAGEPQPSPAATAAPEAAPLPGSSAARDTAHVAMGVRHSLFLKHDQTIWAYGGNQYGQLGTSQGLNTLTATETPNQISGIENPAAVYSTEYACFALTENGEVYSWGSNRYGMLGIGKDESEIGLRFKPGKAEITGVQKLACGPTFVIALKEDGTVWGWGDNVQFELGLGNPKDPKDTSLINKNDFSAPTQLTALSGIRDIAAGNGFALAVDQDGFVWSWGKRDTVKHEVNESVPEMIYNKPAFRRKLENISSIAAGEKHAAALTRDGKLLTWGDGSFGQLGNCRYDVKEGSLVQIPVISTGLITYHGLLSDVNATELTDIVRIAAGSNFSAALTKDGSVYYWGESPFIYKAPKYTPEKSEDRLHGLSIHKAEAISGVTEIYIGYSSIPDYKDKYSDNAKRTDLAYPTAAFPDVSQLIAVKSDGAVWSLGTAEKQIFNLN